MSVVDIIQGAREIVSKGWCKGALERDGSFCALGALNMAHHGDSHSLTGKLNEAWWPVTAKVCEMGYASIPDFNNNPETTQQDVVDVFSKTLADLGGL